MLKRLKFSKQQSKYVEKLIKHHLYPSLLVNNSETTEKAILRMFRKLENDTIDIILLAMADRLATKGPEITQKIIDSNIESLQELLKKYKATEENVIHVPKLLSGNDIMEILNIPPSPELGKILKSLNEAQISGDVNTKDEAILFVKNIKVFP